MYHKTFGYRAFSLVNYLILGILGILCILPMVHVLAVSFSGKSAAAAHLVSFWPIDFTVEAYAKTIDNENFIRSLGIAIKRTVFGTLITMILITLAAYPLSKEFKGRNLYSWFFVVTMLFSGGLVPSYILISNLHLMNTIWALILPGAVNVWLMILLLNFFRGVPKELEESAYIDGATPLRTLVYIYLPISMPAIATLVLFSIVANWNSWFDGLLYITNYRQYPLATFLQTIIVQQDFSKIAPRPEELENLSQRTVKAAQIFIGALPVLLIYPFLQKYFVKGIVLGAVKE
ncbi:MAG: carbohydrate ABC transporter permease [Gorillibacterium sp.]|nr:carbohydrate ABC transporter permease [Gorillibacterium sp.]